MANTLTGLIPIVLASAQQVGRELVGHLPSVTLFANADRVAKDQTVALPFAPAASASDWSPSMTLPNPDGETIEARNLVIDTARGASFAWDGNEELSVNSAAAEIFQNQITQRMRTLANEAEAAIQLAGRLAASRATGTSGTAPFASDLSAAAAARRILNDNGAGPQRSVVCSSAAAEKLFTLMNINSSRVSAADQLSTAGILYQAPGLDFRQTGQAGLVTAGTGASYLANGAKSVGATSIDVDTGSGTVLAGDCVTFAGDSEVYVVKTALASGTLVLQEPGLRKALADNTAMTVKASFTPSLVYSRDAIVFASRLPKVPSLGDGSIGGFVATDPLSNISFDVAVYGGKRKVSVEIVWQYGIKVAEPKNVAMILG